MAPGTRRGITRIDPDLPVCWEDPDTLRIGFERAEARVRKPSAGAQRLLSSLRRGVESIAHEARRVSAAPEDTRELIAALEPVLLRDGAGEPGRQPGREPGRGSLSRTAGAPIRVQICDDGREVPGLRAGIASLGLCDLDPAVLAEHSDLVILVERFIEPFERAQRWRSAMVPHLPLRFTDRAVHIGPVVAARGGLCHGCTTLALVTADAAVPALAAQLAGTRPASETAAVAEVASAFAGMLVRRWVDEGNAPQSLRVVVPVRHGRVSAAPRFELVRPHPSCACRALEDSSLDDSAFESLPLESPALGSPALGDSSLEDSALEGSFAEEAGHTAAAVEEDALSPRSTRPPR